MATIESKEIPEELLKRLELAAVSCRHNLAQEVVDRLDNSFGTFRHGQSRSKEELQQLAKQIRGEGKTVDITSEFIRMAREWGRE